MTTSKSARWLGVLALVACGGGGPAQPPAPPAPDAGSSAPPIEYVAVTGGFSHACALRTDGRITCWGRQPGGPVPVADAEPPGGFVPMTHVSSTDGDLCGLREDGTPLCWGPVPDGGSLGSEPAPLGTLTSSLGGVACGISSGGAVCWWVAGPATAPVAPPGLTEVAATATGACGLRADGTAACAPALREPDPTDTFASIAAGDDFACAVRAQDGTLACWGGANAQQPILQPPQGAFVSVSAFGGTACALDAAGDVRCWGDLGDPTAPLPSPYAPAGAFRAVAAGVRFGCGITLDGTLACWGWNSEGQTTPPQGLPQP